MCHASFLDVATHHLLENIRLKFPISPFQVVRRGLGKGPGDVSVSAEAIN